jgi:hypothetical protein
MPAESWSVELSLFRRPSREVLCNNALERPENLPRKVDTFS